MPPLVVETELTLRLRSEAGDEIALVPGASVLLGRSDQADLVLRHERVSWEHAEVRLADGCAEIRDLDSTNGIWIGGQRIASGTWQPIASGTSVRIGSSELTLVAESPAPRLTGERLRVGRDPECDFVIPSMRVSRYHCELVRDDRGWIVRDLGSTNGTQLNGGDIREARAIEGDRVQVGSTELECSGTGWRVRSGQGIRVDCVKARVEIGNAVLTNDVTLSMQPGEVLAIVGPSGAGKSTLVSVLSGVRTPSAGSVFYNGAPLAECRDAFRCSIGFVPQDNIIHGELRVREVLTYEAQLRLPDDTSASELRARVDGVLEELGLAERADALVSRLSGGERKRVNIAVELLTDPEVLFLDEPTAGLDPGLEMRVIELLKTLARRGRTVILITHSPDSVQRCDRVAFLAPGGYLAFVGSPQDAVPYFECGTILEIYSRLAEERSGAEWRSRFTGRPEYQREVLDRLRAARQEFHSPEQRGQGARTAHHHPLRQWWTLSRRCAQVIFGDRRYFAVLALQSPIIALILGFTFPDQSLNAAATAEVGHHPIAYAPPLLMMLGIAAIWCGVSNAGREIVKEIALVKRASLVYQRPGSYFASKVFVLGVLSGLQSAALLLIVSWRIPLHADLDVAAAMFLMLWATALVATLMGLTVSAMARTSDQAVSLMPLVIIPQVVFSGVLLPLEDLKQAVRGLTSLAASRWCTGGLCDLLDLTRRYTDAGLSRSQPEIFDTTSGAAWAALAFFAVAFSAASLTALHQQTTSRGD